MLKFILKLLVTVAILFLLFRRIDSAQFFQNLSHTRADLFASAAFFLFLIFLLPAISQRLLFKNCRLDLKIGPIYAINLKSMFYSLAVPGDIAAGLARLLKFSRAHDGPRASEGEIRRSVLVVMAADRLLNMAALIVPIPFLLFVSPLPDKTVWFQKTGALLAAILLPALIIAHQCPVKKIFRRINRGSLKKIGGMLEDMTRTFQTIPARILLISFFISLACQMSGIVLVDMVLAESLGLHLPWLAFFSIAAAIRFIRYIPVTVSGIGIREGLFPFFLQFFGVPFEKALSLGTLGTALVILTGAVGGLLELIGIHSRKTAKKNRKKKILILCGDAAYNRGDRGNLASQIDLLTESFPGFEIVYDSYLPERDAKWYPARVIPRGLKSILTQFGEILTADVIVWGGGALLTDNASRVKIPYWAFKILFIRKILRKKVMAWSHGVIVQTRLGAFFARIVLNSVDLITVRDQNSLDNVKRIGVANPRLYLTADPAVLLKPESRETGEQILRKEGLPVGERPIIAIPVSFCSFNYEPGALIPRMYAVSLGLKREKPSPAIVSLIGAFAELADHLVETYGAEVLLIPTYVAPWEKDEKYLIDVKNRAAHGKEIHVLRGDDYPPKKYVAMFHHFDLVLSVPMHHNFFSLLTGAPCINLFYEPKGKDFYAELGAADWLMNVRELTRPEGFERLKQKIALLMRKKGEIWPPIVARFEKLKNRARLNTVYLRSLIEPA